MCMKKTIMLKKNYEFKNMFSRGKFYYGEYIYFYIKENNLNFNKFGIAISKKQGKAVERNHIKRIIRENYKNFEKNIKKGINILIVINKDKDIKNISFKMIEKNFYKTLMKANIFEDYDN